jgi:hypothetical protein
MYCLHHQGARMIEAVHISETSVSFSEATLHYIPERCNLYFRRCENMKSQNGFSSCKLRNIAIVSHHFLLLIREGLGLNLSQDRGYISYAFPQYPHSLQAISGMLGPQMDNCFPSNPVRRKIP